MINLIYLLILSLNFSQALDRLQVDQYQISVSTDQKKATLEIKDEKRTVIAKKLESLQSPKVNKLESFKTKNNNYIFLDYEKGFSYESRFEKICQKAILWQLTKEGKLVEVDSVDYQCHVNTNNDIYKTEEFYHPYTLNKSIPKIEFSKPY